MTLSYDQVFANYYLIGFVGNLHCSLYRKVQLVWISSGAVTNYGPTIARCRSNQFATDAEFFLPALTIM
jgi:hypothetical protein